MDLDELMKNLKQKEDKHHNKHNTSIPHDYSMNDMADQPFNLNQTNNNNINHNNLLNQEERNTNTNASRENADILRLETLDKELEEKRGDIIKKFA